MTMHHDAGRLAQPHFIHLDQQHGPVGCACSGDTGLLDHLLKHLADQQVTPAGDRRKRRHHPEGHME